MRSRHVLCRFVCRRAGSIRPGAVEIRLLVAMKRVLNHLIHFQARVSTTLPYAATELARQGVAEGYIVPVQEHQSLDHNLADAALNSAENDAVCDLSCAHNGLERKLHF